MRKLPLLGILLPLLGMSDLTYASEANLTWDNATQNVDGSAIEATGPTSLTTTTIEWSACDANDQVTEPPQEVSVAASITETTIATGAGRFCFRAYHTNEGGFSSDYTPVRVMNIDFVPLPPGNFAVTAITAYSIAKRKDGFILLAIGTVPLGTPCDKTQSVNGKYVVPTDLVEWDTPNRAPVVVADCS